MDWDAEGLLDGLEGRLRADRARLLDELYEQGIELEELRAAASEGRLPLLAIERALGPASVYTLAELAERAGVGIEELSEQIRALGLSIPEADERRYDDRDVEAARTLALFAQAGLPRAGMLEVARVMGQSMSRVAESVRLLAGQAFIRPGDTELDIVRRQVPVARDLDPVMATLLGFVYRVHMLDQVRNEAVIEGILETGEVTGARRVAIAFADLVGFTQLGEEAETTEISSVAERLVGMTSGVARPPVRIVKMIGDAAMLVSPEPRQLLDAALDLVDVAEAEPEFPELRAGLAAGEALNRWGDWYGRPVNLASRVASRARPGSVLVTAEVRDACLDVEDYRWSAAGAKRLKGIRDPVPVWRVRRGED